VTAVDRWDVRPAAREEEGTPSAVLTVEQAEALAYRVLGAIADRDRVVMQVPWSDRVFAADRERVASDLTGLRLCWKVERFHWSTAWHTLVGLFSDGLRRTAALYGVTP
jgi:hypothetical protein